MENEQRESGYYAIIPAPVMNDDEVPPLAKLLYGVISGLISERGYCYSTNDYLAKRVNTGKRNVVRLLNHLEEQHYIRVEDATGGKNIRKIYAAVHPFVSYQVPHDKNVMAPMTEMSSPHDKNVTQNNKEKNKKKKTKLACEYEPEIFERLWNKYPRHEGKGEARYAWDELRPDRKLMKKMSDALDRFLRSDEWRRGIGIPWLVRWLNERRWEWEIGTVVPKDEADEEDGDAEWLM